MLRLLQFNSYFLRLVALNLLSPRRATGNGAPLEAGAEAAIVVAAFAHTLIVALLRNTARNAAAAIAITTTAVAAAACSTPRHVVRTCSVHVLCAGRWRRRVSVEHNNCVLEVKARTPGTPWRYSPCCGRDAAAAATFHVDLHF